MIIDAPEVGTFCVLVVCYSIELSTKSQKQDDKKTDLTTWRSGQGLVMVVTMKTIITFRSSPSTPDTISVSAQAGQIALTSTPDHA